jgi:hypothetical protein
MPPVKLHWYDGGILPERPEDLEPERTMPESGTIFVGDKGKMWCETYSESPRLIPETAMAAFVRPPRTLPRVPEGRPGHEKNWLDAIRQKGRAVSDFDYAGPFTEAVLLGNVALHYPGTRLFWDAPNMKISNMPDADQYRPAAPVPRGLVAVRQRADEVRGPADRHWREDEPGPRGGADVDGGLGIEGPRELRDVRRFSHEAMATVFEVYAVHPDEQYAAQAAQAAFELTDRLERELSRFLPNSDISRINHLAAGEQSRVSPSTLECLVIARHVFDFTGGAFDISIGTGLPSLELDAGDAPGSRDNRTGVQVDLGGIGKGYAVDLMAELLEEWGLAQALVHGGFSSVLALEAPDGARAGR